MMTQRIVGRALLVLVVAFVAMTVQAQNLELGTVEFFSPAVDRQM